ncbi:hypothetical protein ID866_7833 [Astraeus odoratus]|nr:hypothetical protein ID866_7833 [Astraeus odoratus]
MPYVDIPSHRDYVSLWYRTNAVYGNVGSFEADKPTIILLHPLFLDSTWLQRHFDDPRLCSEYNMIAFDQRTMGRSRCRPSELHDCYVDAADIAHAMQVRYHPAHIVIRPESIHRITKALFLPPSHFIAFECISVNAVLRLTTLWPELVLSLTLCNVPPPTELKRVFNAYDEIFRLWCYAPDLDSFEHGANELVTFMTGETASSDLNDELIAYWEVWTPPTKRLRVVELVNIIMNNEHSAVAPLKHAEKLRSQLVNAEGGARLYIIKGARACMCLIPSIASLVNQVFSKFLATLPRTRTELVPPKISVVERTKLALRTLAELIGDPSYAHRDPRSILSFSCVSAEVAQSQLDNLKFYARDIDKAYCPLGRDGRPLRKYSERQQSHWFYGDERGMSHIGAFSSDAPVGAILTIRLGSDTAELLKARRIYRSQTPEPVIPVMPSADGNEPITEDMAQDGRMRRTMVASNTVEKQVVKGSMNKLVNQSASMKSNGGVSLPKVGGLLS